MHRDYYPVRSKLPRLLGTIDVLQDRVAMLEAQLQEARDAAAEPTTRRLPGCCSGGDGSRRGAC
jgi:hypothetical protein